MCRGALRHPLCGSRNFARPAERPKPKRENTPIWRFWDFERLFQFLGSLLVLRCPCRMGWIQIEIPKWSCMYWVLSLQDNFQTKKPQLQLIIEEAGHICLFLPQFHCKLNPIEMLWSFAKYCACLLYYLFHVGV